MPDGALSGPTASCPSNQTDFRPKRSRAITNFTLYLSSMQPQLTLDYMKRFYFHAFWNFRLQDERFFSNVLETLTHEKKLSLNYLIPMRILDFWPVNFSFSTNFRNLRPSEILNYAVSIVLLSISLVRKIPTRSRKCRLGRVIYLSRWVIRIGGGRSTECPRYLLKNIWS